MKERGKLKFIRIIFALDLESLLYLKYRFKVGASSVFSAKSSRKHLFDAKSGKNHLRDTGETAQ